MSAVNGLVASTEPAVTLSRLLQKEEQAAEGADMIQAGADKIALALFEIQEEGLWLSARDHDGRPFRRFNDYVADLADRISLGRTAIYKYKGLVRFAISNKLVEDLDEFTERGGVRTFNLVRSQVNYDRETGAILSLPDDPDNPDPTEAIRQALGRVDPSQPPREQAATIRDAINPDRTEIYYGLDRVGDDGGYHITYSYSSPKTRKNGFLIDADVPPQVLADIRQRLRIGDRND